MKLAWSFFVFVTKPIVAYTETFINAKLAPTTAKRTLVIAKPAIFGINKQAIVTIASASNIDFLYPILVMYDATKKETIAIVRSLKASRMLAAPWVIW
ncbi:MAG: hypothetical protein NVSMB45_13690 [Ginsengibacter sp.]